MFHQVEGLAIGRDISMANLKWTLEEFCRAFFEVDEVELRFRASHFLHRALGRGRHPLRLVRRAAEDRPRGKLAGDPRFRHGPPQGAEGRGIDPTEWQGFAFGMGIDRLAMLKYGIPDLRAFFESDLRWLRHYGFAAGMCQVWRAGCRVKAVLINNFESLTTLSA